MRKFCVHTLRGQTNIYEVEISILTPLDDASVIFLPKDRYKAFVLKPEALYTKNPTSDKMEPPAWFEFAFHDSIEGAQEKAVQQIRTGLERRLIKEKISYTEADVQEAAAQIRTIML